MVLFCSHFFSFFETGAGAARIFRPFQGKESTSAGMGRAQFIIDNPGLGLSGQIVERFFFAICLSLVGTIVPNLQYYLRNSCQGKLLDFYDLDKKKLGEG